VHRRMQVPTGLVLGFVCVLALGVATSSAEDRPLLKVRPFAAPAATQPLFSAAPNAAAAQLLATSTNEHQFGVGVRVGGVRDSFGANVRYFFYSGPLGVQADVWAFGVDFGSQDLSSVQFMPSVIYRFVEYRFETPVSLVPVVGAGLSFIHSRFGDNGPFFMSLGVDDTDIGVMVFGGVELFFDNVPNLGVSGELMYTSNDDIAGGGFARSLGGVSVVGSAHWYFW